MQEHVVALTATDPTAVTLVGGKAASLAALAQMEGVDVPSGFVVTTAAFRQASAGSAPLPEALAAEITSAVEAGEAAGITAWAVRSSATAEDQPTTSFAGQHDSYLGVRGAASVIEHVRRCWASLHTERAVAYRNAHEIDHRSVQMAVVVQELVDADASGVLFTADPLTGHRGVAVVEAVPGLGDDLVSGQVDADRFEVEGGRVRAASVRGGRTEPALTDAQATVLVALGRQIEAVAGRPQDIEWCRVRDRFRIVQARAITTLFPIPAAASDGANHVYVSVGHQQMMTDPMKPLGLSVWQRYARPVMHEAGGRLFVEVTDLLAAPATRAGVLHSLGSSDPLIGDALQTVVDRDGFLPEPPEATGTPAGAPMAPPAEPPAPLPTDPAIVAELVAEGEAALAESADRLRGRTGPELFDAIAADIEERKAFIFRPRSHQVLMAGFESVAWLNAQLAEWLGEQGAADVLSQSVPGNVTSEMGLALLDVADVVRRHPAVVAHLEQLGDGDDLLAGLGDVDGGDEVRAALEGFLDRYGMRGVGEIDLTRPRWSEHLQALLPVLLGNVRDLEPGESARRFAQGEAAAAAKAADVLARVRALPDGEAKAAEVQARIDRVRTFIGYREHPKYFLMRRLALHKTALRGEIDRLVADGVLRGVDDAWYLRFEELEEAVRTGTVDLDLVDRRRAEHRWHQTLTPPRVLTSDGEAIVGTYRRDGLPDGALVGLAVSAGVVEGRARVVHDLADADLAPGDILVTAFTDPSWSPLFVRAAGLVTEVGGLTTHGAVVAREYGLPAVVGVEQATRRIRDGQRIRLDGTSGWVELLD